MSSKLPIIPFRLSEEENLKFKFIASANNRKINDELKMIVQKHIREYENEHGQLIVGEDGSVTIAQPAPVHKDKSSNSKTG